MKTDRHAIFKVLFLGVLCAFSFSCKKHTDEPAKPNPYVAQYAFPGTGQPIGMCRLANGNFIIQHAINISGKQYAVRTTVLNTQGAMENPVISVSDSIYQNYHNTIMVYDDANNTVLSVTAVANDTGSTLFFNDVTNGTINTLDSIRILYKNHFPVKILIVNDGYIIVGHSFYVIKLDKQFKVKWNKTYTNQTCNPVDAIQFCDGTIGLVYYVAYLYHCHIEILRIDPGGNEVNTQMYYDPLSADYIDMPDKIISDGNCNYYLSSSKLFSKDPKLHKDEVIRKLNGNLMAQSIFFPPAVFSLFILLPNDKGLLAAYSSNNNKQMVVQAIDFNGKGFWQKTHPDNNLTKIPVEILRDNDFYYLLHYTTSNSSKSSFFTKDKLP